MLFEPLASRMRPHNLSSFIGQDHLVTEGKIIHQMIHSGTLFPLIFWGPPGTGKTTLARIIAQETTSQFMELSATSAGVSDIRDVVKQAEEYHKHNQQTILFIDEIHRFNKAQQDRLLPYVEKGVVILIGATTENPSFGVIAPLLSRCRVLVLKSLSKEQLQEVATKALKDEKYGLGIHQVTIDDDALDFLLEMASGDARIVLNALEVAVTVLAKDKKVTLKTIEEALQHKALRYDKDGEEHYNVISAFIKSMRASDVNAALYYLGRMIEAGEDPLFIARRMVIFASEDIGLAQPTALVVANSVFRACELIGVPECQINLAHGVAYLCRCEKDRGAYEAYFRALDDVKNLGNLEVPLEIRNAPTKLMKELGYGKGYEKPARNAFSIADAGGYPKGKSLLPEKLKGKKYFGENSSE